MPESSKRRRRVVALTVGVIVVGIVAAATDGELDVPEWTDVPGVDLPLVGNDPLRCDVVDVNETTVRIDLWGGSAVIDDYVHLHVNGEETELLLVDRTVEFPLPTDGSDAYIAVATEAGRAERFWCGIANAEEGVIEK